MPDDVKDAVLRLLSCGVDVNIVFDFGKLAFRDGKWRANRLMGDPSWHRSAQAAVDWLDDKIKKEPE